jgi:cytochrome b subunit of formate dehydrogenase
MPERRGRKLFFWLHATLAVLNAIGGIAMTVLTGSDMFAIMPFVIFVGLTTVFGATAVHLRP